MDHLRTAVTLATLVTLALMPACDRPRSELERGRSASGGGTDSDSARPPGYIVDSILQPGEALRRFRQGLPEPTGLDGPSSRDELFRRFAAAFKARDRAQLEALAVGKAEYAFLVYPELRISREPYRQPPEIAWLLMSASSGGGLTKLLNRASRFEVVSHDCAASPEQEGGLRMWSGCTVRVRDAGATRSLRLFGVIVERGGRFKFASYANAL